MSERPLTSHWRDDSLALTLAEYERAGGYRALRRALIELEPKKVQEMVAASRLRGRGGAGFETGKKWSFVPMGEGANRPKYFIANADEMEPGAFKDRFLMEKNPHLLLEGLLLGAYAIEAEVAYVFLRGEYGEAARRLSCAIAEARAQGYIGENVLGKDIDVDVYLHISAGRYMCGEETALLNALEGRRATPRAKPPFPPVAGLFGKPTIVNNVETLCNVPGIIANGVEWYLSLSRSEDTGTKLFGVSGKVRRPGLWELPMGITFGELLHEYAGGMVEGTKFRGGLPGGASTGFLTAAQLEVKLDFESVAKAGSRLGTGTVIVLDDQTCPVGMLRNLEHFFAQESCGFCTPCRDGLPWVEKILAALEEGQGRDEDLGRLRWHTKFLGPGLTYCALAPGAMEPLASALTHFSEDFLRHVREHRCPWR